MRQTLLIGLTQTGMVMLAKSVLPEVGPLAAVTHSLFCSLKTNGPSDLVGAQL